MASVNLTDFDPNVDTFWLACMTGRWKASLKRQGAMVVFSNWAQGKLYKVEGGRFHLIADKNPNTHDGRCDYCGQGIRAARDNNKTHYYYRGDGYQWAMNGSKKAEPLKLVRLCVDCIYGA
jgi:hypothetical protein